MSKLIFMSRDALAQFLLASCPMPNRRMFVADDMIQLDGMSDDGMKVLRRMFAFPNGEIVNLDLEGL